MPHGSPTPRRLPSIAVTLAMAALAACSPGATSHRAAGDPERVTLAVPAPSLVLFLPVTLAEQLGYYTDDGLDVRIQDFHAGSKALQALLGGSADVVSGFYEHTIHMAAKGQPLKSFVTMARSPGLVLAVSPTTTRTITRVADLKGAVVGVSAPGSGSHFFLNYLLGTHGMSPDDVSVQGIGLASTAVAAMEQGAVDAAVMAEPAISQLHKRAGRLTLLADTRTERRIAEIFGTDSYPSTVLYARSAWISGHEATVRKLARAITRALSWIEGHSPEEIADRMPEAFQDDDRAVYVRVIAAAKPMFSADGTMRPQWAAAARRVLSVSIPGVRKADIDLSKTYTDEFLERR